VDGLEDGDAEHSVGRIPEVAFDRRAHVGESACGVDGDHVVRGVLDQAVQVAGRPHIDIVGVAHCGADPHVRSLHPDVLLTSSRGGPSDC
jgi:hypothetical protein